MLTYRFIAEDITCGHCAYTIHKGLSRLDGVEKVRVDVPSRRVEVDANEAVSEEELLRAFTEIGYPAVAVESNGEASTEPIRDYWKKEHGAHDTHDRHGRDLANAGGCHVG